MKVAPYIQAIIQEGSEQLNPLPVQSETTDLINEMATPPDAARQKIINEVIYNLKQSGIWYKLDKLLMFAAHTNGGGEALLNWINPSIKPATLSVTPPAFTSDEGFTGDASAAYIDTQFNPSVDSVNYQLNNACQISYSLTDVNFSLGAYTGATQDSRTFYNLASLNGNLVSYTRAAGKDGLTAIFRRDDDDIIIFSQFNKYVLASPVSTALQNKTYWNLAVNAPAKSYASNQVAMYAIGESLTDTEYYNLKAIIEDYLIKIGAL